MASAASGYCTRSTSPIWPATEVRARASRNGAWDRFQLDTYGELLAAALMIFKLGGTQQSTPGGVAFLRDVVELSIQRWQEADEGIREIRGGRRHFVFSKSWRGWRWTAACASWT